MHITCSFICLLAVYAGCDLKRKNRKSQEKYGFPFVLSLSMIFNLLYVYMCGNFYGMFLRWRPHLPYHKVKILFWYRMGFFSVFLNRKHIFGQNSCSEHLMREMKLHQTWQRHLRFRASWSCLRYVSCYYYHYYYCYNNNNNNNNDNYYYYYYYYYYYRYYRYLIYFSVRFKRSTIWANLFATFKFSFQLLIYSFFCQMDNLQPIIWLSAHLDFVLLRKEDIVNGKKYDVTV